MLCIHCGTGIKSNLCSHATFKQLLAGLALNHFVRRRVALLHLCTHDVLPGADLIER